MKKTVIFDFGGTLDTNGIHWSVVFSDAYKKAGENISTEIFNYAYVNADRDLKALDKKNIKSYEELILKQAELQWEYIKPENGKNKLKKAAENIIEEMKESINLSKSVLFDLKKSHSLALVSNFYGNLGRMCESIDLARFFDLMVDSETEGIEKPHPGIFSIALKRLNAKPEDTYVVGDSYERDIVPAKILGCRTIWLKKKSFKENKLTDSADYIIGDLKEVLNICQY